MNRPTLEEAKRLHEIGGFWVVIGYERACAPCVFVLHQDKPHFAEHPSYTKAHPAETRPYWLMAYGKRMGELPGSPGIGETWIAMGKDGKVVGDTAEAVAQRLDVAARKASAEAEAQHNYERRLYCEGKAHGLNAALRMLREAVK